MTERYSDLCGLIWQSSTTNYSHELELGKGNFTHTRSICRKYATDIENVIDNKENYKSLIKTIESILLKVPKVAGKEKNNDVIKSITEHICEKYS